MITCQINNQSLVTVYDEVVADSVKYLTASFTFSDDWNGYSRTVIFSNYSNNKVLAVNLINGDSLYLGNNTCYIPHEVIESPGFSISVFGIKDESIITTDKKNIVVRESGYKRGEIPEEPTPTDVERIIGIATSAKNVSDSVRADADAGLFKGEKGDKGDPGEDAVTDEHYSPQSANAQSGKAVAEAVALKQNKTDNNLITESKNIVGAINENAQLIENVKNYVGYEPQDVIGLQVDFENNTFKRLGGAEGKTAGSDFNTFNMFGGRKRCNVADDGTINAYYGDENYTEDGTNGQVMVYQPKFYYKVVPLKLEKNTVSNIGYHIRKVNYYVSDNPRPGFKLHPAFYDVNGNAVEYILFSAYEGSMWDASQDKYVNDSVDTSIAYADGDLLCSLPNKKPISGLRGGMGTKAIFEAMANNRGSGWHLETIKATSANQLLMIIEIGMMNTQTALGNGVTGITDNTAYNCSSLTGSTSSLGNGTGSATSTINEKGGTETTETATGKVAVTYRGVENPWGNIFKHIQGVNIWGDGHMAGGQPYICDDLTNFNESTNKGSYSGVGFTLPNGNGYIKAMGYGNPDFDWLLMPSEIGGDSSLPVGDYCYVTANLNGYMITRLGGTWFTGTYDGGFCWYCTYVVDNRNRSIGGRLVYIPTAVGTGKEKWRRIAEVEISAENDNTTSSVVISEDINGQPFALKEARVYIYMPADSDMTQDTVSGYFNISQVVPTQWIGYGAIIFKSKTKATNNLLEIRANGDYPSCCKIHTQALAYRGATENQKLSFGMDDATQVTNLSQITAFNIQLNGSYWRTGAKIIIEGIDK